MADPSGDVFDRSAPARPASRTRVASREILAARSLADAECQKLLADLKRRCPDVFPPDPLPAGTVGPELELTTDEVAKLVGGAAEDVAGASGQVVWTQGGDELLVELANVSIRVGAGTVLVDIPVRCDEVGRTEMLVPFAVGDKSRPAGLVAATEDRPRGPLEITVPWGEALVAFAWAVVLRVTASLAGAAGQDQDGAPLIPAALATDGDGLRILTQARHEFDRIVP